MTLLPATTAQAIGCLWHYGTHIPGVRLATDAIRRLHPKLAEQFDTMPGHDMGFMAVLANVALDQLPASYQEAFGQLRNLANDLEATKKEIAP